MNEENKTFADIASEATPRPWKAAGGNPLCPWPMVLGPNDENVAMLTQGHGMADAKLICECVNYYDECKAFHLKIYDSWQAALRQRDKMRKALEEIQELAAGMTSDEDEGNALEILNQCAAALDGNSHPSPTSPAPNAMAEELAVTRREVERLNMRLAQQYRLVSRLAALVHDEYDGTTCYEGLLAEADAFLAKPVPCAGGDAVAPEKEGSSQ